MSSDDIKLTLDKRQVIGKQVRALRRQGRIPAVIHNHGKESVIVDGPILEITKVFEQAGKHHPVDLKVDDQAYLAIIKDVDFDPRKNTLRHIVFNAVRQNEKVKAEVPVLLEGDSLAQKAGLMILPQLEDIEIEATPRNIPDKIIVNIEALAEIGDRIIVSDLKKSDKYTIVTEAEHPIVSVIETPAQQSEEDQEKSDTEVESAETTKTESNQQEAS